MNADTFQRLADEVEIAWGVHLYARLVDDTGEPRTDWYYVSVPRDLLQEDRESVLTVLLHEWGHRTVNPRTVRRLLLLQGVARAAGIGDASGLVNAVADVWVDTHYLDDRRWGEVYEKGLERHLDLLAEQLLQQFASGRGDTLEVQRLAMLFDLESMALCRRWGEEHEPVLPITADAWSVLCDETMDEVERVRVVAGMAGYLYPRIESGVETLPPLPAGLWGANPTANLRGASVGPILRDWSRHDVDLDERDLIELLGPERGRWAFESREIDRVYGEMTRAAPGAPGGTEPGQAEPAGLAIWRWGEPPTEFDWASTMSTFGLAVPGVTTLRKRWDVGAQAVGRASRRALCLIADDSGSTWGGANNRIVEAAAALVESARAREDRVALVVFGDDVVDAVPPGYDYETLLRRLVRLSGMSGGTRIVPALRRAHLVCVRETAMLTCVLTDSDIADADSPEIGDALEALAGRGPVVHFDVSGQGAPPAWSRRSGVVCCGVDPGVGLADQVLQTAARAQECGDE